MKTLNDCLEIQFKKLVPYKALTGPELAAIHLAYKDYVKQFYGKDVHPIARASIAAVLQSLVDEKTEAQK